ncbi:MAG: DUF2845 domain-containing protein [Steroidobacteraceae bacterium]
MKKQILAACLAMAALAASTAAFGEDDTRCGSQIVTIGMSKSDVQAACGDPATSEDIPQDVRDGDMVVGQSMQSRWTYVSGAVKTTFVFDQDKLIEIHVD